MNKCIRAVFVIGLLMTIAACTATNHIPTSPMPESTHTIPFPRQEKPDGERAMMDALTTGTLVVVNNCIRLVSSDDTNYLLIWPPDYNVVNKNGEIEVLNQDNKVVAKVGDKVRVSGGEIWVQDNLSQFIRDQLPPQCTAPYWKVGEILP